MEFAIRRARRVAGNGRIKRHQRGAFGNGGLKSIYNPDGQQRSTSGYQDYEELVVPLNERRYIETLTESSCRWPIGDPQHKDFHFCNCDHMPGSPYCEFHSSIAFQPAQARRRDRVQPVVATAIKAL